MRAVVAIDPAGRVYRVYARGAAAAFALVVLYTLVAKLPGGELARDWTHTALHVVTGCAGVYAGWITDRATPAKAFTATLALAYGTLGLFGWFIDGLFMGSAFRIPLQAADNVFHLVLGVAAALTVAVAASWPAAPPSHVGRASASESGEPSAASASANAAVRRSRRPPHSLPNQ